MERYMVHDNTASAAVAGTRPDLGNSRKVVL
jgi:hypothetical protein